MNCKVFKNVKEGQSSFRITKNLVDTTYIKARAVKKKGEIVIILPCDESNNYMLECRITKVKK